MGIGGAIYAADVEPELLGEGHPSLGLQLIWIQSFLFVDLLPKLKSRAYPTIYL